jgi:hydroxymethylbilane synthase
VICALKKLNPSISSEIIMINTKGDVDKRPLFSLDKKGIFEKELNEAVIRNKVDFAVHSLKDIPSDFSNQLTIASIPKRDKPNDVLVNKKKLKLKDLPPGAVIGTSSLRRAIQLMKKRPDLKAKPIRGNVDTRIKKSVAGEYDSVILAEAGLRRLGMTDLIVERFNVADFVPPPGQGAIAIVCRKDNEDLIKVLKSLEDPQSRAEIEAERALLSRIEAGCRFPVGAIALSSDNTHKIVLYASIFSADGTKSLKIKKTGTNKDPRKLGIAAANMLLERGAMKLAEGWRAALDDWNERL